MNWIFQLFFAALGVMAFAILFHAPRRCYFPCSLCGAGTWLLYLLLMPLTHESVFLASAGAVVVLTILGKILSVVLRVPATMFIVTGIFPLVPGTAIYYTAYYLMTNQTDLSKDYAFQAIAISGAIAIGIIIGSEFPFRWAQFIAKPFIKNRAN